MNQRFQAIDLAQRLYDSEVHLWKVNLDVSDCHLQRLYNLLSDDERAKADRYVFVKDRAHSIIGRGTLRMILASYLGKDAEDIRFDYRDYGKPYLGHNDLYLDLRFNLSHSHNWAMIGVTHGKEIGVDIELIRTDFQWKNTAKLFLSSREFSAVRALTGIKKYTTLFNYWVQKEAYVKATGKGLFIKLDQIEVSLDCQSLPSVLNIANNPMESSRWSLHSVLPCFGYAGAFVVERNCSKVELRKWHHPAD